ncbi:MAG: hypothetical protein C0483_12555 [Pirellula sp.]|nr:hypothetical protein [Pirellula sp.]
METFQQVWESSRVNAWSSAYLLALWSGVGVLVLASCMPWVRLRRFAKLVAILGFAIVAAECSAQEIQEKWRIRREWADAHADQMTESQRYALTVDGANLTLGPLLDGRDALLLLLAVAVGLSLARIVVVRLLSWAKRSAHAGCPS